MPLAHRGFPPYGRIVNASFSETSVERRVSMPGKTFICREAVGEMKTRKVVTLVSGRRFGTRVVSVLARTRLFNSTGADEGDNFEATGRELGVDLCIDRSPPRHWR